MERRFIRSGVPGLDKVLGGGFLEESIVTVSGPTGAGKSTLALQFLYNGAVESNEPGLYISIEESRADFQFHVSGYAWDFKKLESERKFTLLDYPIHEVDQILNQYSAVQEIINSIGVRRVVIDSIMPIALYFQSDDERKKGFLKLIDQIRKWHVTTLIVSEDLKAAEPGVLPNSHYGIESYTDGWINLSYRCDERTNERRRYIEVLKMKGVAHSCRAYQTRMDENGFTVLQEGQECKPQGSGAKPSAQNPKPSAQNTQPATAKAMAGQKTTKATGGADSSGNVGSQGAKAKEKESAATIKARLEAVKKRTLAFGKK